MLTALLGDDAEMKPLKRLIIERTQGDPFFMEDRLLLRLGVGRAPGAWPAAA